jgi:hypothetical protein
VEFIKKYKVKLLLLIDELDNKVGKIPLSVTKGAGKKDLA